MIIKEILVQFEHLYFIGNQDEKILDILPLDDELLSNSSLTWCNDKNWQKLQSVKNATIIISEQTKNNLELNISNTTANYIVVENPRQFFAKCLQLFQKSDLEYGISASATIDPTAQISDQKIYIGSNVVIEKNVEIGDGVRIGHNTVIKKNTIIGSYSEIGCNCTIGGVGFGYEKNENGQHEVIPHIGKVKIGSKVEIGNNVCIDRAVLGATIIQDHVKIDNLVHIAHGVCIGENSLIIANAMIAGSVNIGTNVWIAPSSSIIQKKNIGDNAIVGLGSVVLHDVEQNAVVAGVPAKKLVKK